MTCDRHSYVTLALLCSFQVLSASAEWCARRAAFKAQQQQQQQEQEALEQRQDAESDRGKNS